ncbi:MAG: hypothetical protein JWN40_1636 [Phycisphaerales bacterium]|nr:hypothetical protein [Phycisphaerales bacterium]
MRTQYDDDDLKPVSLPMHENARECTESSNRSRRPRHKGPHRATIPRAGAKRSHSMSQNVPDCPNLEERAAAPVLPTGLTFQPMDTAPTIPPPLPAEALSPEIDADLPCSICDYNLKGLAANANCPECGQPVGRTLRFGLIHGDPAWLRRQAAAVPWLAALCVTNVVRSDFRYLNFPATVYIGHALNIAASGVALLACWRLAVPDPRSTTGADEDGSIRRGLRLAALLLLLLTVAALPFFHPAPESIYDRPTGPLTFARPVLLTLTDFLAMLLLARLAHRSASRSLRTHARAVLYIFPPLPIAVLFLYRTPFISFEPFAEVAPVILQVFDFVAAAALFAMLILLGRMYEVLRAAAAAAASAATS